MVVGNATEMTVHITVTAEMIIDLICHTQIILIGEMSAHVSKVVAVATTAADS